MDKNIVTYSRSMTVNLTSICSANRKVELLDQSTTELAVPYSAIKMSQKAKRQGAREAYLISGERPDTYAAVRARLDQWGFTSFVEYIYTVAELIFLEGLLPNIDVGYLTKAEMQALHKIVVATTINISSIDPKIRKKYFPNKSLESRIEMIRNAGEINMPISTSLIVGLGDSQKSKKEALEKIRDIHLEYGNIQNVIIKDLDPNDSPLFEKLKAPKKDEMLKIAELARKILPEDVHVTVPYAFKKDPVSFINLGIRDFGQLDVADEPNSKVSHKELIKTLESKIKKKKLGFQHRLPIFSRFIVKGWYSRKTAQILDKYKLLLKSSEEDEEK